MANADCGWISGGSSTQVANGLDVIQDFAVSAINDVENVTNQIQSLITGLEPLDVDIDLENAGSLSSAFSIDPPTYFTIPDFDEHNIAYNPSVTIPNFTKTATVPADFSADRPELTFGTRPEDLDAEAPTGAPTVGTYAFPDAPTDGVPDVPTLAPITIPSLPDLTLPDFSATDPGDYVEDGFGTFSWTEGTYSPTVRSDVVTQLQAILGGATGIPTSVWDMIEVRARRQIRAAARQGQEEAVDFWAGRGHFLTNGALRKRIDVAADLEREGISDVVRELVIQDARIYVERLNNAIAQGIALEGQLVALHSEQANRSLQAARLVFEIGLQVAQYRLSAYNAKLQSYLTKAQVFQTQMQGELLRLEKVRVEIEAQQLVGQLNQQKLEIFRAQVQNVLALYDLFSKQVDAVVAKYDADRTRVAAFGEQVRVYATQVSAKESEWRGYAESVRAELAKLETYKVDADVFSTRVQAYGTQVQADKNEFDANADKERLKISWLDERVKEFAALVEQERARISAQVATNELNTRKYEASGRVEASRVQSDAQRLDVLARNANLRMQAQLQETSLKIQEAQNVIRAQSDLVGSVLAAHSQIAASSLAALNYSAQISDAVVNQSSCSTNYQY